VGVLDPQLEHLLATSRLAQFVMQKIGEHAYLILLRGVLQEGAELVEVGEEGLECLAGDAERGG
jgi:hypothetical protein